jgi:hypothetical protein
MSNSSFHSSIDITAPWGRDATRDRRGNPK